MNPHLIIICNEYPPSPGGGIGTFYKILAESLAKHGYRVTVGGIYSDVKTLTETEQNGVKVYRLPASPQGRGRYRLSMFLDRWRVGRWVRSQVVAGEPTVIDTADYHGWLWAVGKFAPRIIRIHGADTMFMPLLNKPVNPLKRYFEVSSLHRADHIVSF